jgi:hypothetical protein
VQSSSWDHGVRSAGAARLGRGIPKRTSADPEAETHVVASYVATDQPAIVARRHGSGWVLLTGPHPERQGAATSAFIKDAVLWALGPFPGQGSGLRSGSAEHQRRL